MILKTARKGRMRKFTKTKTKNSEKTRHTSSFRKSRKTQLYFVPWIPVQIAEKKKSFLSSAGDSWNRKPGRLCEYREPTLHPSAQCVFRKPQLIFVFQGHNVPTHTFILVEECGMDIESAFPPHAVAPIFTRYEHNGVGLTNEILNVDPLRR